MYEIKDAVVDSILREQMKRNQGWIEQSLCTTLSETLQLEVPYSLSSWAARHFLPDALATGTVDAGEGLHRHIVQVLLPPGEVPSIKIERMPKPVADGMNFDCYWNSEWLDGPIAVSFEQFEYPVIVLNVAYKVENGRNQKEVAVVRRDSVEGLFALLEKNRTALHGPRLIHFGDSPLNLAPTTWADVIMDQTASRLLRDDFLSFFDRREWFRSKRLPFRRGYLLHGPPGNGKTSAIRAMLSYPGVTGYAIDLMAKYIDDQDLRTFFKKAAANPPAIVLFEDIDRFFSRRPEEEGSQVSMQQLLNSLDGIDMMDGVIVVAMANNPESLDTAILRRPGRFDRVIEFGNPSEDLRARYLRGFCPDFTEEDLDICAAASDGLSFAQLRESYILASQTAYEAGREVIHDDISSAIALLKASTNRADRKRTQKSGFEADSSNRLPLYRA
jgi:hypothetical protein